MLFSFFQGCFSWLICFCVVECDADGISALKEQHAISTASTWTNAVPIMFQFVALSTFEGDCMMFASLMMYIVLCIHPRTEVQNRSPCTDPPKTLRISTQPIFLCQVFPPHHLWDQFWTSYGTHKTGITNRGVLANEDASFSHWHW